MNVEEDQILDEAEEPEPPLEAIFPLGACTVRTSLRMEDETYSKEADAEVFLALNTVSERDPEQPCAICYYDSAAEDVISQDEEIIQLESELTRHTVVPVGRYASLGVCVEPPFDEDLLENNNTLSVCSTSG